MDMFSLQSFTKLPSQPEWLCERAQPPCPGMEPYGSRSSLGSAGSCLLGQEGALCWEMLHFSPQGIKQWFCKPSAPLWMDKAPYKTRELFSCCRHWHSCDSHNTTGSFCFLSPLNHPWLSHSPWLGGFAGGPAWSPHAQPVQAGPHS